MRIGILKHLSQFQIKKEPELIIFLILFFVHLFLQFYQIETKNPFGWDQVDNAWAAQRIIENHEYPLAGMQAKLNSGIFIGPLYYYLAAFFYFLTYLDPIASGILAGVTSIFTFFVIYFITSKLFSKKIALIAVFIYTVSFYSILFDKTQWPVNFITSLSLIIFYSLFNVLNGKIKYLLLLALALGFSFHIHFTSIFYIMIVLFSLFLT